MKYIPDAMTFGTQIRSSLLIINMIFIIVDLHPKFKYLARFGLKNAMYPIFMKFSTQNKLNMPIMNILIGIDDLDPKLQICKIWSQNRNVLQFL